MLNPDEDAANNTLPAGAAAVAARDPRVVVLPMAVTNAYVFSTLTWARGVRAHPVRGLTNFHHFFFVFFPNYYMFFLR